ncbi:MAG: bis(5'-nucleosyl)-tetraphosphatase (symmetrical) YqeK [Tissierellia bacterium]|nr:bis(5'-nucleosyl)-tetraphosphatase (symmetrical) YqeK [Tissierellia bacterium]
MNLPYKELLAHVGQKRYEHVLRVMELCEEYALLHELSQEDAKVAAFYHDFWKYKDVDQQYQAARNLGMGITEEGRMYPPVYHGHLAADYVLELGYNQDIANAIRYHTTGRAAMSGLEMALYLADYLEPKRKFPGVDELRELAREDLNAAMRVAIEKNMDYLKRQNQPIHPDSLACYHYYVLGKGSKA